MEMVTTSRTEYERFRAQGERISALEKRLEQPTEAIRLSCKKQPGSPSKKLQKDGYEQLSLLFNEAEAYLPASEKKKTMVAAHTRQKWSSRLEEVLLEDVPVEVVGHRMGTEELECPSRGKAMVEIGKEVRRSLVMIPVQVKIREDWLKPVYEELHRKLVQQEVLHADETTLQVLKEPGKSAQSKSYMWPYWTGGDSDHPIILYEYSPNRKPKNAEVFLEGFKGWLHADGYPGYHSLSEHTCGGLLGPREVKI